MNTVNVRKQSVLDIKTHALTVTHGNLSFCACLTESMPALGKRLAARGHAENRDHNYFVAAQH